MGWFGISRPGKRQRCPTWSICARARGRLIWPPPYASGARLSLGCGWTNSPQRSRAPTMQSVCSSRSWARGSGQQKNGWSTLSALPPAKQRYWRCGGHAATSGPNATPSWRRNANASWRRERHRFHNRHCASGGVGCVRRCGGLLRPRKGARGAMSQPKTPITPELLRSYFYRALREKGWAYVYQPRREYVYQATVGPSSGRSCLYRNPDGSPACLIGEVLHYHGVPLASIREGSAAHVAALDAGVIEPGGRGRLVMNALDMAQIRQDEGYSWAEAIEEAINILEYDMQDDQRCTWWNSPGEEELAAWPSDLIERLESFQCVHERGHSGAHWNPREYVHGVWEDRDGETSPEDDV